VAFYILIDPLNLKGTPNYMQSWWTSLVRPGNSKADYKRLPKPNYAKVLPD